MNLLFFIKNDKTQIFSHVFYRVIEFLLIA